jgi:RimJ/RimL family protein N-acetyltransferase
MIVEAGPDDRAKVEALLTARLDQAMFPVSNLRTQGLRKGGYASDHPYATRFWLINGTGVVALTQGGMVMALLPEESDLAHLSAAFAGLTVTGAAGPARSIRPVLQALGLHGVPARLDEDEPGFALDLTGLKPPHLVGRDLVPAASVPRDLLIAWRAAATVETQGMSPLEASDWAALDVDGWLDRDSHRVLLHDGQPVALTGFNARLPEIVQVGGVYTPPHLRNRGYARTAVSLHLAEAQAQGATRAVLFAATPAAARAYRAIGFQPASDFALVLYRQPVTLPT